MTDHSSTAGPMIGDRNALSRLEDDLRDNLVCIGLEWERRYGVAPAITCAISEYDAARLVGHTPESYSLERVHQTAVTRGTDFLYGGLRYQVKACRPSGKPGSKITWVPKATNYDWDRLIWLLYNKEFEIVEAWEWTVEQYRAAFHDVARINPAMMRAGHRLDAMVGPPNALNVLVADQFER